MYIDKIPEAEKNKVSITKSKEININIKEVNRYVEEKIIDMLLSQGLTKGEVAQVLGISKTALWKKYNKNI